MLWRVGKFQLLVDVLLTLLTLLDELLEVDVGALIELSDDVTWVVDVVFASLEEETLDSVTLERPKLHAVMTSVIPKVRAATLMKDFFSIDIDMSFLCVMCMQIIVCSRTHSRLQSYSPLFFM